MQKWNIQYLKQLHSKYSKLSRDTKDPTLSLEYENTANSILDIIDRYYEMERRRPRFTGAYEVSSHKSIVSSDFSIVSDYGIYCPYVRFLSEYYDILAINPNTDLPIIDTNVNKLLSVSSSFYESFGGIYSNTFKKMAKSFKDTIHLKKITGSTITAGQTYSVYNTDLTFFELGYNKTLQDYVSTIHEFGHGISCNLNPGAMWDFGKYCFIEVDSLFFELVGTDYLGETLGRKKDAFDINMHVLKDYIYSAMLISVKLDMYSMCDRKDLNNHRFVKNFLHNETRLNKLGVSDVMNTYIREYMHYIISYLTAIELYLIYQESPDVALELLFKIIKTTKDGNKEYLEYIKSLGLEPGKNFDNYITLLFNKAKEVKDEKSLQYKN
jgi:hypothetical protein